MFECLRHPGGRGRFLELGTGTGIATTWLLNGLDAASTLVSVDTDEIMQRVARDMLGRDRRLMFVTEDGLHFLQKQSASSFGLVFADAMPGKYEGLEDALRVINIGGFYVIDDMLPQPSWPVGHAEKIPVLMEKFGVTPGLHIVPLVWASGVVIAVRTQQV